MKKSTKRAIGAIGLMSAAAAGLTYAAGKVLAKVAVERKAPEMPKKVGDLFLGSAVSLPVDGEEIEKYTEALKNTEMEEVEITSYDGLRLVGHVYEAKDAKRTVIAMHGWRSAYYRDFSASAPFMHEEGCNIIFPDQRGQNGSEGEYIGFGTLERFDCLEWINYAVKRFGAPIYLVGVSMGATTVLMTSGFVLNAAVHGIIADCGFTSADAIWSHVAKDNLHINYKLVSPIANAEIRSKAKYDSKVSTVDALKVNLVPVLFIHGSSDSFVPVEMTYENYIACRAEKELLIVPGAGHGLSYLVDTPKYQKTVLDFFAAHDGD